MNRILAIAIFAALPIRTIWGLALVVSFAGLGRLSAQSANPNLLLATFQEGRYTGGGAVSCGYAVSQDGGLSWTRSLIPGLTQVSGGPYFRASDPVAAIDHRGTLYLNNVAASDSMFTSGVLTLSRSTNGGASFEPPVTVFRPSSAAVFPDKNWITVNGFTNTPTVGRVVVTLVSCSPNPATRARRGPLRSRRATIPKGFRSSTRRLRFRRTDKR